MKPKNIEKIIKLLKEEVKDFENPVVTQVGDISEDPFKVLISCLLSLRTKDTTTGPVSLELFNVASTPKDILRLPMKKFQKIIRPCNYYITKSKKIKDICKVLIEEYDSKVPDDFDELMKLKGVGKKTAAIVMVYGHRKPDFIPVDVHVHVISNRLGWIKTKNAEDSMDDLMKFLPKKYWYVLNELMVLHGQNICFTNSPICSKCAIEKLCPKVGVGKRR